VLKRGGRAIFKEPVRDSRLLRAVRKCIPYTAPNVSPFERPLLSQELEDFSRPFSARTVRAFSLPFVNASEALPPLRRYIDPAHAWDRRLLKRIPALTRFAGIRVIHLVK